MKLSFNLKLTLRTDKVKADGSIPVYWSVRYLSGTNRLPTGKSVFPKDWDIKNNCFKSNTKENQLLNAFFAKEKSAFNEHMLQHLTMNKPMSLTIASNFFRSDNKVTFNSFFERQIEIWKVTKAHNTIKSYRSTLNVLQDFRSKLEFGELTYSFIEDFDYHMTTKRGNSTGGKFTKHKCLKAIIRQAIKAKHMTINQNPYNDFPIKAAVGKREFLTIEEVTKIMNLEIPEKNGFLSRVRDLFVFSCLSGLRYSDLLNLKWANVDTAKKAITVEMTKTKKQITIPLVQQALDILNVYRKHSIQLPSAKVLPQMTNQVLNRELKELIKKVGIEKPITFHCARHSFASNLIEADTPMLYVRDLLGHQSLNDTQIYAKSMVKKLTREHGKFVFALWEGSLTMA